MLYFSEANQRGNHAGTKARNDAERILKAYGAHPINTRVLELRENSCGGIQSNIANRLGFIRYYLDLLFVKNEIVVIQYPMLAFDIQYEYVQRLAKRNKVVFLVHDIQSLRRNDTQGVAKEIQMLNLATALIVHNRFMEDKLISLGIQAKNFVRLDCFDYLFDGTCEESAERNSLAFAGNLEKSEFLAQMCEENPKNDFHFYGPGWNKELESKENAKYEGSFAPDLIPGKLIGQYGLVWDGKTTTDCTGVMGEYTRINNPHKMSLYIAAGMPVIVWEHAAVAEFVMSNGIGIAVPRIDDLQNVLGEITPQQYSMMKARVSEIRKNVLDGAYLKKALGEVERIIS